MAYVISINRNFFKGVFAYKGSYKIGKKKKKVKCPEYFNEPWYIAYSETWRYIEQAAEVQYIVHLASSINLNLTEAGLSNRIR